MTAKSAKPAGRSARFAGLVFGLVFLGVGLILGYFLVFPDVCDWLAARAYVSVPGKLYRVELQSHRGKSATYNVRATYRYTFRDQTYTGSRVAISDGADNVGDYQRNLYHRLKVRAAYGGGGVVVWVDPVDPRNALLDREMRWGLLAFKALFMVLFSLAGLGVAALSLRAAAVSKTAAALAMTPQPSGRIVSNTRTTMWTLWIFAVLWNLISSPGLFVFSREMAKQNWPALFILLFPVVGIWLLYKAVQATLRWRRFGALTLTLAPYPGAIGGTVSGTIEVPERFRAAQQVRVAMTCIHRRTSGSGKNRSTTETALWQDETRAQAYASARGTRLSFGFSVPPALPPSAAPSNDYVFWVIDVDANLPGVDLVSRFEVPMAPVAAGATAVEPVPEAAPATRETPDVPARIVRIFKDRDATVFYYPLFRYPAVSVGLLVFGALFAGAAVFLTKLLRGGVFDLMLWPMIAIFGGVGVLILAGGLYALGNTLRVEVSPRGLATVRRIFGFGFARHAPLDAIKSIEAKMGSQSSSGGKISLRYRLVAHISDGRRITVGSDIPGHPLADHLARQLRDACGLRAS